MGLTMSSTIADICYFAFYNQVEIDSVGISHFDKDTGNWSAEITTDSGDLHIIQRLDGRFFIWNDVLEETFEYETLNDLFKKSIA